MEQTFEQMKDAAKEVHRRFYKYCTSSFNDIVNTDNVRDLRRVVIRYRDYVSDPRAEKKGKGFAGKKRSACALFRLRKNFTDGVRKQ